jgi:flagellar biosynthesis protein FliQ
LSIFSKFSIFSIFVINFKNFISNTIFIFHNRKIQALFCALNALLIVGWYICFFVVAQMVDDKSWGTVDFVPKWPAVMPAIALIFYLMARHAILADEKLVRSMDRIR